MRAIKIRSQGSKMVAMVIIALAIQKDMIASLQVLTTRAGNILCRNMALVVLAHESMSKAALSHQSIEASRQSVEVWWGLELWRSMRRLRIQAPGWGERETFFIFRLCKQATYIIRAQDTVTALLQVQTIEGVGQLGGLKEL